MGKCPLRAKESAGRLAIQVIAALGEIQTAFLEEVAPGARAGAQGGWMCVLEALRQGRLEQAWKPPAPGVAASMYSGPLPFSVGTVVGRGPHQLPWVPTLGLAMLAACKGVREGVMLGACARQLGGWAPRTRSSPLPPQPPRGGFGGSLDPGVRGYPEL